VRRRSKRLMTPASASRRWKDGHCSYGEGCKYAHGEAELRANIVAAQQFEGLPGPGASLTRCIANVAPLSSHYCSSPDCTGPAVGAHRLFIGTTPTARRSCEPQARHAFYEFVDIALFPALPAAYSLLRCFDA